MENKVIETAYQLDPETITDRMIRFYESVIDNHNLYVRNSRHY
jgi:hypothetical protein